MNSKITKDSKIHEAVAFWFTTGALVFLSLPEVAFAQEAASAGSPVLLGSPHFMVAIIAGLVMAVAFQMMLTQLSIAAGVTSIGDLTAESSHRTWRLGKIGRTLGVWALITASLSLFASAWLAVELSMTANLAAGAVLGLVIWSVFYIVMTIFEVNALTSLVGSLIATATTGLRSIYGATTGIFSKSPDRRMADAAATITASVRDEIFGTKEMRRMQKDLQKCLDNLSHPILDPPRLKEEILALLDETEIKAIVENNGEEGERETVVATVKAESNNHEGGGRQLAQRVDEAITQIREEAYAEKDRASKVVDGALRLTGKSANEARELRERVENYLLTTGKQELNPHEIKRELEELFARPAEGYRMIRERLAQFDTETVAALVARRTDLTEEEASRVINTVVQTARDVTDRSREEMEASRERVREKVRHYLDQIGRPEVSYEEISEDIRQILDDPKAGPEVLKQRFQAIDRDTLKAILASRENVTEDDAEKLIQRVEKARDDILRKTEQVKEEVERRITETKTHMMEAAEQGRRTVSAAAWWCFATAVASAVASVLGGILAVTTV